MIQMGQTTTLIQIVISHQGINIMAILLEEKLILIIDQILISNFVAQTIVRYGATENFLCQVTL